MLTSADWGRVSTLPNLLSPAEAVRAEVRFVVGDDGPSRKRNCVEALVVVLVKRNLDGAQVVFELLHRARPYYGTRNAWLVFAPGQGDLSWGAALLTCYGLYRFEDVEGLLCKMVAAHAPWLYAVAAILG